ncbi:unnamed protein product [Rhizophagus irregularis]|nr:unnamed protein product [Rhizophagus irregularis]CAB5188256.1 unnamed protein product [Rhizophagus irregularis]
MSEFASTSTATEDKHAHTLASLEAIPLFKLARVTSLNIARVDTQKEFSMRSQCEMLGEESIGRVDYAIKDSEYLVCVTVDNKQNQIPKSMVHNI